MRPPGIDEVLATLGVEELAAVASFVNRSQRCGVLSRRAADDWRRRIARRQAEAGARNAVHVLLARRSRELE